MYYFYYKDTVKGELAVAASSQGLIGRGLGSSIPSSRKPINPQNMNIGASQSPAIMTQPVGININANTSISTTDTQVMDGNSISGDDYLEAAKMMSETTERIQPSSLNLAPRSHSVAAVAEEQWEKTGIGFRTKAEQGTGFWNSSTTIGSFTGSSSSGQSIGGGSSLLADLIQQNLIHDQYDR